MCPADSRLHADFSLVFPADPGWVRPAREAVRASLATAQRPELTETAMLLTSEVVTNAVNACCGGSCSAPLTLYAEWAADRFRVLVQDDAPGLPAPSRRPPEAGDEHGRGLFLVEECADRWGVCRSGCGPGHGKAIWFELEGGPRR
jgi:anti-sigma regulatory factor (Ser/Thr protein kinase)